MDDLAERVARLESDIKHLHEEYAKCVSIDRFRTVELLCYGAAGLLLTSVGAAIVALVIRH